MLKGFLELEKQFKDKSINLSNIFFNKIIQNFDFICLTNENYENEIKQNENEIITIDYYIDMHEKNNNDYLIFCMNNTIYILQISLTVVLDYFTSHFPESTFYCVSDDAIQYLEQNRNKININYSTKNQFVFINNQIENFIYEFVIPKQYQKMNIIKKCLVGYLIKISLYNSNINRLNQSTNQIINIDNSYCSRKKYILLNRFTASASVFLAYNIELQKLFIVKFHNYSFEQHKLFKRELENYKKLNHPFLPKIFEDYIVNDTQYLVIEYINGVTIDKFDLKKLNENERMNILFEIMIVFHYIHSIGYVYRDLKNDNIIIDENNTAILIDLDRVLYAENKIIYDKCSFNLENDYRAPEIKDNQPYTNKVDIYSLGCLINEYFIIEENIDNINSKLKTMAKCCLQKDPNDRPTISQLIRYFYLYILSTFDTIQEINIKLIEILEYNFMIKDIFDPDGFCTLGMIFMHGYYIEKNKKKAIKYFTIATKQNDLLSTINLSEIYMNEKNYQNALKYLKDAALQNDPYAQIMLGSSFLFSNIFQQNIQQSIYYLNLAAKQNYIYANYLLGIIYLMDTNLKNSNKALYFFLAVINYKNVDKTNKNSDFYNYRGKYILPNLDIVMFFEFISCRVFRIASIINFISMQIFGLIQKNKELAENYLLKISLEKHLSLQNILDRNSILKKCISNEYLKFINNFFDCINFVIKNAKNIIGKFCMEGIYLPKDILKAIKYFQSSENQNNYYSYFLLGYLYSNETFNQLNIEKALKYYKLIDENPNNDLTRFKDIFIDYKKYIPFNFQTFLNPFIYDFEILESQIPNNLGDIYFYGEHVARDINKALYFYTVSADKKNYSALYKLGYIYFYGKYVEKNIEKAIDYFQKSATYGDSYAKFFLGIIFYDGKYITKNINYSLINFVESAEKDVDVSLFYLGIIYYKGIYIDRDKHKSLKYFINASNLKLTFAKNNYAIMIKNGDGIEKNIYYSIQILKEAMNDKDEVSRFNLAHIYFFNDDLYSLNLTIQLLVSPSLISIDIGFKLLCLAIIRKCTVNHLIIDIHNIHNIIIEYNSNCDISIIYRIMYEIIMKKLSNLIEYQILYEQIENDELMYINHNGEFTTRAEIESNYLKRKNASINNSKNNITMDFYDGFGELK